MQDSRPQRFQILLITAAAGSLFALMLAYQQAQRIWQRGFEDQERLQAELQIDQIQRAHQSHLREIARLVGDYALWDDTVVFLAGHYPAYPQNALDDGALTNIGVTQIMLLRPDGRVYWTARPDAAAHFRVASVDAKLLARARELLARRPALQPTESIVDVVSLDQGSAIVAAQGVYRNGGQGPMRGLLVVAKALTPATLADYSRFSPYPLDFIAVDASLRTNGPAAVRSWLQQPANSPASLTLLESNDRSAGFLMLRDNRNVPVWLVKVNIPRTGYGQWRKGLARLESYVHVAILLLGTLSVWFALRARRAMLRRRDSEQRYRAVIEQSADGVMISDVKSGQVLEMNPALRKRLGYHELKSIDCKVGEIFGGDLSQQSSDGKQVAARYRTLDGRWLDADVSRSVISYSGAPALAWTVHDTTERHRVERDMAANQDRLSRLAHEDMLTGLPNRRYLQMFLQDALARVQRGHPGFGVLFIDVDRFKNINDTLGHEVGDAFLCRLAERLRAQLRDIDLLVRSGGDEFIVVAQYSMPNNDVSELAQRLLHALLEPLEVNGRPLTATASIGIALCPEHAREAESLLKYADTAMYEAKNAGRNRWALFDANMHARVHERLFYETELRAAVQRGELTAHYQPIVDVASGRIEAFEALARWRHAELGWISPMQFIPIAEDTALIVDVGRIVLQRVLAAMRRWRDQGLAPLPVAVNVSAMQLERGGFDTDTLAALARHGIAPDQLMLELTESALLRFGGQRGLALQTLRQHGVRIAVDDFGTGYSSLSYLKNLQVDSLKIDRSFVAQMGQSLGDTAIVRAVVAMADHLNLRVVAEGVESEEQIAVLRELGCSAAQGYYFGKPIPADECAQLQQRAAARDNHSGDDKSSDTAVA